MFRITYDPEVDVLSLVLYDSPVVRSEEKESGIVFDYDEQNRVVAIEILDVTR